MIRPRLRQRLFLTDRAAARRIPCALAAFLMPLWLSPGAMVAWAQDRPDGEALEPGAPADREAVPYRLELLVSLLQNELEADRRRLGQLAAERVRLAQERDAGRTEQPGQEETISSVEPDDGETEPRASWIQGRIEQIDQEIALLRTRMPALEADLADVERRLRGDDGAALFTDEQRRVQEALVYLGGYDGRIDGQFGRRTEASVRAFQRRIGAEPSGTLTDEQETALLEQADALRQEYGVQALSDPELGYSLIYPRELLPVEQSATSRDRRFESTEGESALQIDISDQPSDLRSIFVEQLTRYEPGYSRLQEDWFVLSGTGRDEVFYEIALRSDERLIRVRLTFPPARREIWQPFTVILLNSLRFGSAAIVAEAQ